MDTLFEEQVFVPYEMPKEAWNGLVLVGEAPGAEEARLGHPFVGRSGKLLTEILEKAGIVREACLIANVFRRRPPDNKVDFFFLSKKKAQEQAVGLAESWGKFGSLWLRAEAEEDVLFLKETLSAKKPRLIVALGRTPFWALTGQNELLKHVGEIGESRLCAGVPVMATYHPSFILRGNWKLMEAWEAHFRAAMKACVSKDHKATI